MPSQTPLIEVSHLPSAASFYAAIIQPLGLRFLFATPPTSPIACLHFGTVSDSGDARRNVVFSVAQSATPTPRPSHIYIDAYSSEAVIDFHKQAEELNRNFKHHLQHTREAGSEVVIAKTADFDGNMIQASYSSRGAPQGPCITIENASIAKEARRVLDWQEDVAKSVTGGDNASSSPRHPSAGPGTFHRAQTFPAPASRIVRIETITTDSYTRHSSSSQPDTPNTSGVGLGKAIFGTLLGAAAGAAFAYAMVRSESPEKVSAPVVDTEHVLSYAPGINRRSTAPSGANISHHQLPEVVERIPARSYVSERSDRSAKDIRPRYIAQYSVAPPAATRELGRIEEASYVSSRSKTKSHVERSQDQDLELVSRPLTILPAPTPRDRSPESHVSHRSRRSRHEGSVADSSASERKSRHRRSGSIADSSAGERKSRHRGSGSVADSSISERKSRHGGSVADSSTSERRSRHGGSIAHSTHSTHSTHSRRSRHGSTAESHRDDKSYHTARSSHSDSTVKPSKSTYHSSLSRVGSKAGSSTTTIKVMPKEGKSVASVRPSQVLLPESALDEEKEESESENEGGREWYEESVAPSDSVSSVGEKREWLRLKDRMRVRY